MGELRDLGFEGLPLLKVGAALDGFLLVRGEQVPVLGGLHLGEGLGKRVGGLDRDVRERPDQIANKALLHAGDQGLDKDNDGHRDRDREDREHGLPSARDKVSPGQLKLEAHRG